MKSEKFFKEINIWKPVDKRTTIRYRCFEVLPEGKFFVKAKDYFYENSDDKHWENVERYFRESLFDGILNDMAKEACETIEAAIAKHELDFEEMIEEFKELERLKTK